MCSPTVSSVTLDGTPTGSAWASGCGREKNLLLGELEKVAQTPFKKLFFKKKKAVDKDVHSRAHTGLE